MLHRGQLGLGPGTLAMQPVEHGGLGRREDLGVVDLPQPAVQLADDAADPPGGLGYLRRDGRVFGHKHSLAC
ncbi:hypothetical protein GCM10009565_69670 [Amycolatopsis albidoflavus]